MSSIVKTFSFLADAEGLADGGNHANIVFAFEGGDGDPLGCVKFGYPDSGALTNAVEYARRATTGQTFETWGVPSGSEITSVQLSYKYKKNSAPLTAQTIKARLIDETGTPIHDGDLISASLGTGTTGWLAGTPGASVSISPAYQASTQDVRLELDITVSKSGGAVSPNETLFDGFELTITYTGPGQPGGDFDIRLYHKVAGAWKRKTLPPVTSADFELNERGGMGSGSLSLPVTWEEMPFDGTEFVDIRLFGQADPIYRGFVKIASHEMTPGETASPTLQSLVERLNHYPCLWAYAYGGVGADLSVIAGDLITDVNGHFADTIATDLDVIDVTLNLFDPRGKSVAQALNSLCDYAPNQAIWGVQASWVGGVPVNTVYFRPKPTTTGKYYSIGKHVTALVYPQDTGAIINSIKIEGGPVKQPNLCFNPSFEEVGPAGETVGNLLLDHSFEDNDAAWTLTGARKFTGMDATAVGSPKSGKYWLELDQNTESGIQAVLAPFSVIYTGIMWVRQETAGTGRQVKLTLEGLDVSDVVVVTANTGFVTAADDWEKITVDLDPTAASTVVKIRYRVETNGGTASNDGVLVDDTALVEKNGEGAVGWRRIIAGVANASTFQWNYKSFSPTEAYHGGYMVRSDPSAIAGAGDYVEIRTAKDRRIEVSPNERYSFIGWFYTPSAAATITLGIIEYDSGGTVLATNESDSQVINGGWVSEEFWLGSANGSGLTMNANTRSVELFVRHKDNDEILIDALYFGQGGTPPDFPAGAQASGGIYWPGENYERILTTDSTELTLSAEASTSISDYGDRMEVVSEPLVIDETSVRQFATDYLNESAVPSIMAGLTVDGLEAESELLVPTDGKVKIVNLPDGPDALSPARINYTISGDKISLNADLGHERPTIESLLRHVQGREGIRAL